MSLQSALDAIGLGQVKFQTWAAAPTVSSGPIPAGDGAISIWQRLAAEHAQTGYWPIIIGDDGQHNGHDASEVAALLDAVSTAPLPQQILENQRRDRQAMIEWSRQQNIPVPDFMLNSAALFEANELPDEIDEVLEWPPAPAVKPLRFTVPIDEEEPQKDCVLALIKTSDPSTCTAHLGFGGFNECPGLSIQVAAMRQWHAQYGAVPACMTHDVLEMFVPRPPLTPDDARKLAREHFLFCTDIVAQGTGSIEALAQTLWQAPQWYFWWD